MNESQLTKVLDQLDSLLAAGQNEQAVQLGQPWQEHYAGSGHFCLSMSEACRRTSRLRQARELAAAAYQGNPDDLFAISQYARCLLPFADHAAMLPLLQRGLQLPPQPWCDEILASCAVGLDEWALALDWYTRLLLSAPGHPHYRYMQSLCLSVMGRTVEARALLRALLAESPAMGRAWWTLMDLAPDDVPLPLINSAALNPAIPEPERLYFWHVLGQLHHRQQHYSEAFAAWTRANLLKKKHISYDRRHWDDFFAALLQSASSTQVGSCTESPIFIIGLPRSGSTLVEQLLVNSMQVVAAGELRDTEVLVQELLGLEPRPLPLMNLADALASLDIESLGHAYARRTVSRNPAGLRICDKNPFNFLWIGLMAGAMPNAKFVHVFKNPLEACLGTFRHLFASVATWSYDLQDIAHFYRHYQHLMHVWQQRYPQQIRAVSYEELVAAPESVVGGLYDWLGLSGATAMLDLEHGQREVRSASANQVRRGLHKNSLSQSRHYREQLSTFSKAIEQADILRSKAEF